MADGPNGRVRRVVGLAALSACGRLGRVAPTILISLVALACPAIHFLRHRRGH
jgi:hypothetical protein